MWNKINKLKNWNSGLVFQNILWAYIEHQVQKIKQGMLR